uniref:Chlorophyll a/b binding protein CP29 n=1 Tax=Gymnochlora stellata TaxID=67809 RepID=B5A4H8_GYMST|nr:chlorophyll a/b binding protein CP29 [Gymnochlora stellata]
MNRQLVGKISICCTVGLSAILACMLLSGSSTLGAPAVRRTAVRSPGINRMMQVNAKSKIKPQAPKKDSDPLWLPNTVRPTWLDGSLPGDRGFDPLGLSKPAEYLQYDVDQLDQNQAVNFAGKVIGKFDGGIDEVDGGNTLSPYSDIFGLRRFRECELIHGRWAMLATLGAVVAELSTGVPWDQAGKVELDGARYLNFNLPFTVSQLTLLEVLLVGGAEIYRNTETDLDKRLYPGGYFDPLGLTTKSAEQTQNLREAEIKHGRLAMVAAFGCGVQAFTTGEGLLDNLSFLN